VFLHKHFSSAISGLIHFFNFTNAKSRQPLRSGIRGILPQPRRTYVAVDEARRSVLSDGGSIKSLDFIVSTPSNHVAGGCQRPAFSGGRQPEAVLDKLVNDRRPKKSRPRGGLFGENFRGLFVFAYDVLGDRDPLPSEQLFEFRSNWYGFVAIALRDYVDPSRPPLEYHSHADRGISLSRPPLEELLGVANARIAEGF
jgi:hypothetical protein